MIYAIVSTILSAHIPMCLGAQETRTEDNSIGLQFREGDPNDGYNGEFGGKSYRKLDFPKTDLSRMILPTTNRNKALGFWDNFYASQDFDFGKPKAPLDGVMRKLKNRTIHGQIIHGVYDDTTERKYCCGYLKMMNKITEVGRVIDLEFNYTYQVIYDENKNEVQFQDNTMHPSTLPLGQYIIHTDGKFVHDGDDANSKSWYRALSKTIIGERIVPVEKKSRKGHSNYKNIYIRMPFDVSEDAVEFQALNKISDKEWELGRLVLCRDKNTRKRLYAFKTEAKVSKTGKDEVSIEAFLGKAFKVGDEKGMDAKFVDNSPNTPVHIDSIQL